MVLGRPKSVNPNFRNPKFWMVKPIFQNRACNFLEAGGGVAYAAARRAGAYSGIPVSLRNVRFPEKNYYSNVITNIDIVSVNPIKLVSNKY